MIPMRSINRFFFASFFFRKKKEGFYEMYQ